MTELKESALASDSIVRKILDYARWAPSGDNTQCWRFIITGELSFTVVATDTRSHVVYDLDGHSSHLAHGALMETIALAANHFGYRVECTNDFTSDEKLLFNIKLIEDNAVVSSPLVPFIKRRTVQRRSMGARQLTIHEKDALSACLPNGYSVHWFELPEEKKSMAKLYYKVAKTRLTMKEAYHVHKEIIEWKAQFSRTKIPEKALGVDWLTARFMQWLFKSWERVHFVNTFMFGTYAPRLMLDYLPSLRCSAHFAIIAEQEPQTAEDYLIAGKAVQRFWLTCTQLGLGLQPQQSVVIFSRFLRNEIPFSQNNDAVENAKQCAQLFNYLVPDSQNVHFIGRVGRTELPKARSTRMELSDLILDKSK